MKTLLPIFIALALLIAFVAVSPAQTRVYNPNLPKSLVFQWRIQSDVVHSSWKNADFTISRNAQGMVVYYGVYGSLAEAMANIPALPSGISAAQVSLVPFFNQRSISATDAFALAGNRNALEMEGRVFEEAVSFAVYFGTYDQPIALKASPVATEYLSFEVTTDRTFAYAAGQFDDLSAAETYIIELKAQGFDRAEVMKYLNGQRLAAADMEELLLYAYAGF